MIEMMQNPAWTACGAAITVPYRRDDLLEEHVDHEAVLYDPGNGHTYRLNPTALVVWRLCDGRTTMAGIAKRMAETHEVEFDTALDHVEQLIARLAELDLFEPSEGP